MSRVYKLYLNDILKAAQYIHEYTGGMDFNTFKADNLRVDAVLHNLMIVGEAVKNIPDEIREKMPEVEWIQIGKFRDLVVHHYFKIKLEIAWNIIEVDLPELRTQVEQLLQTLEEEETDDKSS